MRRVVALSPMPRRRLVVVLLVVLTLAAYWQVGDFGFVNLDDDAYVEYQPLVNRGLRAPGIVWAFTAPHSGTWHPLSTLSHALDCELFGVRPGPMHWENVALHATNAILVFLVWSALFGRPWIAAGVAAVFAVNPVNVESVAWISERKNLLSTFFWLLGLLAYVRYVRRPQLPQYFTLLAVFTLAGLSKPMVVTFPCVLLLLDYWPLRRWPARSALALFKEKLPLFVLSALLSIVTLVAQRIDGATDYGHRLSVGARLSNAVVSHARYLENAFWPDSLSVFYAHPGYWKPKIIAATLVPLLMLSWLAWHERTRRPWFLFGWLWFLGTMVPVIGIVQSGAQAMADRYMYIPGLGLFTIVAFALAELAGSPPARRVVGATAAALLATAIVLTNIQVGAWRNSVTLYNHSLARGDDNATVRYLRAMALRAAGRPETEVLANLRRAIEIDPGYINAHTQFVLSELVAGRVDAALRLAIENAAREPRNANLRYNVGNLCERQGDLAAARQHYEAAIALDPRNASARRGLAQILARENRLAEAAEHYRALVSAHRWNVQALTEYGILLSNLGQPAEGRRLLQRAVWIEPANESARLNLDILNRALGAPRS